MLHLMWNVVVLRIKVIPPFLTSILRIILMQGNYSNALKRQILSASEYKPSPQYKPPYFPKLILFYYNNSLFTETSNYSC